MPQQDADASELKEAEEVLGVALVAGDQAAEVLEPREETLDLPASAVTAERTTVLGLALSGAEVRSDQLDAALGTEALVESVAVVGAIPNQSLGGLLEEAGVDRGFDERDFMW
jgi:hypothetical protein